MIDEKFVKAIDDLAVKAHTVQQLTYDGRQYADRELKPIAPPLADPIPLDTLAGLCDFFQQAKACPMLPGTTGSWPDQSGSPYFIHVVNQVKVHLLTAVVDSWGRRQLAAVAAVREAIAFPFSKYLDQQSFIIGLLSLFVPTPERDELIALASNIVSVLEGSGKDDGIAQAVTTKRGVSLQSGPQNVRGRFKLAPYRTFREVEQPESEFVFRMKAGDDGEPPELMLVEADGGAWKITAMEAIAKWLRVQQTSSVDSLPIVS